MSNNDDEKCKNSLDFENGFRFYEKEIGARNLQYKNYNTWANYYALFTGALFVGYYTTQSKCDGSSPLSLLIVLVGLATSICWNLTVRGHYHWMISYIKVLQNYEKELASILKKHGLKDWRAYSIFLEPEEDHFRGRFSTQKITAHFTLIISIAWCVLSVVEFHKVVKVVKFKDILKILNIFKNMPYRNCVISVIVVAVVYLLLRFCVFRLYSYVKIGENMTKELYTGWTEKRWDKV